MFNKSTRSYFFRQLMADAQCKDPALPIAWWQARLMFKGATVAAIHYASRSH